MRFKFFIVGTCRANSICMPEKVFRPPPLILKTFTSSQAGGVFVNSFYSVGKIRQVELAAAQFFLLTTGQGYKAKIRT